MDTQVKLWAAFHLRQIEPSLISRTVRKLNKTELCIERIETET